VEKVCPGGIGVRGRTSVAFDPEPDGEGREAGKRSEEEPSVSLRSDFNRGPTCLAGGNTPE